jgi:hypothetical protein
LSTILNANQTPVRSAEDSVVPSAPTIFSVLDPNVGSIDPNGTSTTARPLLAGGGVSGDLVTVFDNGVAIGSAVVDSKGSWHLTPTVDLSNGAHDLTATDTNAAGTISAPSAAFDLTVAVALPLPSAPTIFSVLDPNVGPIDPNGTSTSARPMLGGGGVSGDIVTVFDNGVAIGSAVVDASGSWHLTPTVDLSNGAHALIAMDTNAAGSVSHASVVFDLTIGVVLPLPSAPTIFSVFDPNVGSIDPNGTSTTARPMLGGGGVAGDLVTVFDNGVAIGSAVVDSKGSWHLTPTVDLSNGAHALTATDTNAAGSVSHASAAFDLTIGVVLPLPSAPVITDIFATDGPMHGTVAAGGISTDGHPAINGTGQAGDTINVYDGKTLLGTTVVGGDGTWQFKPVQALPDGAHSVYVTSTNEAGTSAGSVPYAFSTTQIMVTGVYSDGVLIEQGGTAHGTVTVTGWVADPSVSSVELFATGGNLQANGSRLSSTIVTVTGHTFTAVVSQDGAYSNFTPVTMTAGTYHIDAVATTASGRLLTVSDPQLGYTFTDDWAPAAAQSVSQVHLDASINLVEPVVAAVQAEHHAAVGQGGAVTTGSGDQTIDLNADPASYFKGATAHIEGGGSGIHTLHLTGDHQLLDLTSLTGKTAAAKVSGIEAVDLGGAHNMLKLSLVDVLNLAEQDLFQKDGKQQMLVNGSNGDSVDLSNAHIAGVADGHWMQGGTAQVGGVTYNVYEHSGAHAELLVQQGVQIALHG